MLFVRCVVVGGQTSQSRAHHADVAPVLTRRTSRTGDVSGTGALVWIGILSHGSPLLRVNMTGQAQMSIDQMTGMRRKL